MIARPLKFGRSTNPPGHRSLLERAQENAGLQNDALPLKIVAVCFPEFGRVPNFRSNTVRRWILGRITDELNRRSLWYRTAGLGSGPGENRFYLEVQEPDKAMLIARLEISLLGFPADVTRSPGPCARGNKRDASS
jgi:hypothetical protein